MVLDWKLNCLCKHFCSFCNKEGITTFREQSVFNPDNWTIATMLAVALPLMKLNVKRNSLMKYWE